ncbi:MAG TPA: hypothetical protein VLV83_11140 [Acidobacteriota bacterium]|nr:hypothetical protein [Acidobacteriota bacterium]
MKRKRATRRSRSRATVAGHTASAEENRRAARRRRGTFARRLRVVDAQHTAGEFAGGSTNHDGNQRGAVRTRPPVSTFFLRRNAAKDDEDGRRDANYKQLGDDVRAQKHRTIGLLVQYGLAKEPERAELMELDLSELRSRLPLKALRRKPQPNPWEPPRLEGSKTVGPAAH